SRDPEGALRPARLVETRAVFARMSLSPHVFDPTGAFDESRAVDPSRMTPTDTLRRPPTVMERLRNWFLTGLLVLGPTALTLWVFFRLLNFVDNILGRYLRFAALDYHRVPGLGLLATLLLLTIVGAIATLIGRRSLAVAWDRTLTRIPGIGILYGSTKSLGEALLSGRKQEVFRQVVLVQWPHPGMWRVGFLTGPPSPAVRRLFEEDIEAVFVPHTPNP